MANRPSPKIGRKHTTYIPPIVLAFVWGLYATYHLLGEPETTIELELNCTPLKLTASLHLKMDGWNTFSFPFGARPIFSCENVSAREGNHGIDQL